MGCFFIFCINNLAYFLLDLVLAGQYFEAMLSCIFISCCGYTETQSLFLVNLVSSNLAKPLLTLMQLLLSIFTVIFFKIQQIIHYCFALFFWIYSHHHQFFLNISFCDLDLLFDIFFYLEVHPLLNSLFI